MARKLKNVFITLILTVPFKIAYFDLAFPISLACSAKICKTSSRIIDLKACDEFSELIFQAVYSCTIH